MTPIINPRDVEINTTSLLNRDSSVDVCGLSHVTFSEVCVDTVRQ